MEEGPVWTEGNFDLYRSDWAFLKGDWGVREGTAGAWTDSGKWKITKAWPVKMLIRPSVSASGQQLMLGFCPPIGDWETEAQSSLRVIFLRNGFQVLSCRGYKYTSKGKIHDHKLFSVNALRQGSVWGLLRWWLKKWVNSLAALSFLRHAL